MVISGANQYTIVVMISYGEILQYYKFFVKYVWIQVPLKYSDGIYLQYSHGHHIFFYPVSFWNL